MNHIIYNHFMPVYDEHNGADNSKNISFTTEITIVILFHCDFSKNAKCICKIREMQLNQLIVTHIRKDAPHLGKSEDACSGELQYQPHWGSRADLLISVQSVNESSSEG